MSIVGSDLFQLTSSMLSVRFVSVYITLKLCKEGRAVTQLSAK